MKTEVIPVPAQFVPQVWDYVADQIDRAWRKSGNTNQMAAWRYACERGQGHMLLVVADGEQPVGAVILQRDNDALHCVALSGGMGMRERIGDLVGIWARIALDQGCNRITLKGRKGWRRVLAPLGFTQNEQGYLGAHLHGIQ
jgi:hypothetical protein